MQHEKVISWIFSNNWAITEPGLETIIQIALKEKDADIPFKGFSEDFQSQQSNVNKTTQINSVAVLPVLGPIFPRANIMTRISGATSTDILTNEFNLALADDSIKGIIFYYDTPGGMITGIGELAGLIYQSRSIKPIYAYGYGGVNSAGYWLASAAKEIIAAETAQIGSIGVIAPIQDTREKDAKSGIKTVEFVSSVSPKKRFDFDDKESLASVQRIVDSLGGIMVKNIAKYRGTDVETVIEEYGQGDVFVSPNAYARGLIDKIDSYNNTVAKVASLQLTKGVNFMNLEELKAEHPDLFAAVMDMGKKSAIIDMNKQVASAREEGAKAERERIQKIYNIKTVGSKDILDKGLFNPDATAESVALEILNDQNAKRDQQGTAIAHDANRLAEQQQTLAQTDHSGESGDEKEEQAVMNAMVGGINSGKVSIPKHR